MLLLNEYHEDISKLHVNMMQRRSYYVPFIDTNEAITIKDRNKQNNFFLLNGQWKFSYFNSLQAIKEFDNINDIERYKRCPLLVTRENAVPLEEDEYFVADMIGMKVITEDGTEFGTLSDVMETGANDVYVIDSKEHGEVLMPAIKECVLNVDMESGIITVHLMNGLI